MSPATEAALEAAATLLGCDHFLLRQSLTQQSTRAGRRSSFSMKKLTVVTAQENRDALSKELYNLLFSWLVDRINLAVHGEVGPDSVYVGVLDIFGFEIFENNRSVLRLVGFGGAVDTTRPPLRLACRLTSGAWGSGVPFSFEQLCINFANEMLQRHFNQNVFQEEKRLYDQEGVACAQIAYVDNQDVLDLIARRPDGLIPSLDEEGELS